MHRNFPKLTHFCIIFQKVKILLFRINLQKSTPTLTVQKLAKEKLGFLSFKLI